MALTRLFVNGILRSGHELQLSADQARYLGRALRLRAGDTLTVFNGDDGEFTASLSAIGKNSATVMVEAHVETATESPLKVHLVQGISRGERMDYVMQKATELGVKRITPVLTQYGVVKFDAGRGAKRRDHWLSVARSACEQSGRIRPPLIDEPIQLNTWFGEKTNDADIDLILQPRNATALTSITEPRTKVCLLIGPEGGFSHDEYEDAAVAGFKSVSLGPRILRTETAAAAALAVIQSMWGDLSGTANGRETTG
jgi:16S rRNA (uracil1498-N3)-methyltransferase